MRMVDVIIKKRDGGELSQAEIEFFIRGYACGEIPDYQASAWAMAVLLNGMTPREITDLTMAMAHSGDMIDLSRIVPIAVDKHSTGGVGDKTTLAVEPTVAACGLPVGKMSGRGLGFSGGTLDKLESIPGYRINLSADEFLAQLRDLGIVLSGQSANLAPADGKLYALRDVTGTVQSIPLIAASVMSKKLAAGAQAIVLDVKSGSGAFMHTLAEARLLAKLMVQIGKGANRQVIALLSDMNQPLGNAVGNALELREAIDTLHGKGPMDFTEHCMVVASHMLVLGKKAPNLRTARKLAQSAIHNGSAWEKFRALVAAQGGDVRCVDDPSKLPTAAFQESVGAKTSGYLAHLNAREVGETAVDLGAGRQKKSDPIDLAVGMIVHHKVGDRIEKGDVLFTIHANQASQIQPAAERLLNACQFSDDPQPSLPLFYGVVK